MTVRERVLGLVDSFWFQSVVVTLILVNAVTLGAETSPRIMAEHGYLLRGIDMVILALFVVELSLRAYAHRGTFLRDPWSWFDMVIVGLALMPSSGPFAVLRVLRLLSVIPTLRHVVAGLFRALPGMVAILFLVILLLYVSGVMATKLFQDVSPEYFGDLPTSLFTLFQISTADSWSTIAKDVMAHQPLAWVFFVVFVLVSTFVALNLFVAVAVEALEKDSGDGGAERGAKRDPAPGPEGGGGQEQVLAELRALRAEVASLRGDRERQTSGTSAS
ncbi:hypothetical protein GCM10007079_24640 [Nocardiopsis terrae]|uniref:Voltage-gated sodium channel n=1 Tax=Nocardiopsis terrae TaxID=372655 RepID=A0ABR9HFW6_9ACTN|nr:ion transporter [Nocardiopsis terrae]MBE1457929.1 voltage-gated sodium channel [Nocardiopsis terrae]GHC83454.1 hypothetical protein GCM10007079_24640 [Nocardiopsis terrae]